MTIASGQQALAADVLKHATSEGYLSLTASTVLTIATGAVAATANFYRIDTEGAAASDDLDTITAGTGVDDGHLLVIRAANDARTVVIKHNTGNIFCENGRDQTLNDAGDIAVLFYDTNLSKWMALGLVGPDSVFTNEIADSAVTTAKILDANVTRAKLSNGTALSVIGRSASSSGVPADIAAVAASGSVLRESGSAIGFGTVATAGIADGAVTNAKLSLTGKTYINDTSNATMTTGLTINQGTADDEALALKSSDISHGLTSVCETDTYAEFKKQDGSNGGLQIIGIVQAAAIALDLFGVASVGTATKSTAASAPIRLISTIANGTGITNLGANDNILVVHNGSVTRFILDADGDSHQDVGTAWTNFDAHDDAELLTALSVHVSAPADVIRTDFAEFLSYNKARLEALRLVTFNEDGHHFVNMSRLTMLLVGAVRQVSGRLDAALARIEGVERKLLVA